MLPCHIATTGQQQMRPAQMTTTDVHQRMDGSCLHQPGDVLQVSFCWLQDVSRCLKMSQDVSRCVKMFQDVSRLKNVHGQVWRSGVVSHHQEMTGIVLKGNSSCPDFDFRLHSLVQKRRDEVEKPQLRRNVRWICWICTSRISQLVDYDYDNSSYTWWMLVV